MEYRPLILLGNGIRNNPGLIEHLCSLNMPVTLTWPAMDYLDENDPVFCGRPGIIGQRAANIITQKCTHLYCFGARLDPEQVAYNYERFAFNAIKYVYDIDENETRKFPKDWQIVKPEHIRMVEHLETQPLDWLSWCRDLYNHFRPELDGGECDPKFIHPFEFTDLLSKAGKPDDVFAMGSSGYAATYFMQTFKVKKGQRIHNVSGIGSMGADIPMALGSAIASGRRTICVTGDGGFQMNTQELEVIRRLKLPITFFVLNNGGYASIRANQDARYGLRVGSDPQSGSTFPGLEGVAEAYGLIYKRIDGKNKDAESCLGGFPTITEVFIQPDFIQPRCSNTMNADGTFQQDDFADMTPHLSKEETRKIEEYFAERELK